jgi:hypothetical protein
MAKNLKQKVTPINYGIDYQVALTYINEYPKLARDIIENWDNITDKLYDSFDIDISDTGVSIFVPTYILPEHAVCDVAKEIMGRLQKISDDIGQEIDKVKIGDL